MVFSLPPLNRQSPIAGKNGAASNSFAIYWQQVLAQIAGAIGDIQAALDAAGIARAAAEQAAISAQAAASQAATAAATATSAGSGKSAAAVVARAWSGPSAAPTWQTIASVTLSGVVAGTLRFDTTRLYPGGTTAILGTGVAALSFRIRESGGTVLYGPDTATVRLLDSVPEVVIDDDVALDAARPAVVTTGSVTYELQIQKVSGLPTVTDALADFRAAQA